jgi:hypothetical protein
MKLGTCMQIERRANLTYLYICAILVLTPFLVNTLNSASSRETNLLATTFLHRPVKLVWEPG